MSRKSPLHANGLTVTLNWSTTGQEPEGWDDERWVWHSSGARKLGFPENAFKVDKRVCLGVLHCDCSSDAGDTIRFFRPKKDQPDAAIVPKFYLPHQVTQPIEDSSANTAFDFGRPDLTSARNNADVSGLDNQPFPRILPFNPFFDAQYDFNFVSPPIMAADPLQDLIDAFGIYSTPFDDSFWLSSTPSGEESSSSPFSFPTAHPGNEEQPSLSIATSWPILPPPQPDSPPSPPMTNVSSAAIAAKARSHREPEVDVRNILPETSARSRAPTARKRNAEEAIEVHKSKKVKK
ncbi:hypothetical protein B0H13DRAFT_2399336 [Mycena leptocephala]|nr:hypothetical protein B0H13DRAFT_1922334 [Mycena leptocephala]KAJ7851730.1 hypothetical protein B0H13DRAFT_2399336 [Mycena leptocephala]